MYVLTCNNHCKNWLFWLSRPASLIFCCKKHAYFDQICEYVAPLCNRMTVYMKIHKKALRFWTSHSSTMHFYTCLTCLRHNLLEVPVRHQEAPRRHPRDLLESPKRLQGDPQGIPLGETSTGRPRDGPTPFKLYSAKQNTHRHIYIYICFMYTKL